MSETKRRLYVERDGFFAEASMLLMALAIVFRIIGSIGHWSDMNYLLTQLALPVFSGLLFIFCVLFFGRRAFWTTVIPVVLGVVFFIFRIMQVDSELQKVACIALYMVIVVLYTMAFSHHGLKWVLAAVLLLAFAYHVAIEDMPVLLDKEHPLGFIDGMQEMSVLAIILSLMCISLAMKMEGRAKKASAPAAEPAAPAAPAPIVAEDPLPAPQPTVIVPEIPAADPVPVPEAEEVVQTETGDGNESA